MRDKLALCVHIPCVHLCCVLSSAKPLSCASRSARRRSIGSLTRSQDCIDHSPCFIGIRQNRRPTSLAVCLMHNCVLDQNCCSSFRPSWAEGSTRAARTFAPRRTSKTRQCIVRLTPIRGATRRWTCGGPPEPVAAFLLLPHALALLV
ncbi:hypothetical protein BAUCODRAFT_121725 [Baudoinia panamericana UAMH 10762]|uniref:Secreted protein n=1 Tax=Baudoinia panamericana (strain UAMH 10762) TaxID=717646 RepID=M2NDC5_BAUPA|nr:uncharacterized protein BAUCODRAFT_121725 [Baudoinia panamericana UAMH 10762]EMC97224.1 hypothetical protein BAUCODRAFT_121725 [Baudoinia panamericana UAMH 10762]